MNKFTTAILRVILIGLVLIGCDKESDVVSSSDLQVGSIDLSIDQDSITDFRGTSHSLTITAVCRDIDGTLIPEKKIEFVILDHEQWNGSINPISGDWLTNENGEMQVNYNFVLEQLGEVTVEAHADGIVEEITITLEILFRPFRLNLEVPDSTLFASPDSTKQTKITAILRDDGGASVPDHEIVFSLDPISHGILDSYSGRTDANGLLTTNFSSLANSYGACEVIATLENDPLQENVTIRTFKLNTSLTSLELRVSHSELNGFRGEHRVEQIFVVARNAAGVGIPGVEIMITIMDPTPDKGSILPGNFLTDLDGQVVASYSVDIEQDVNVVIFAEHGEIDARKLITVRVDE